jgi:hypothetical protein
MSYIVLKLKKSIFRMVYQHFDCIDFYVINRFVPISSPKKLVCKRLNQRQNADTQIVFLSGTVFRRTGAKRMRNARCCYRRLGIFYKLLNNKGSMFSRSRHGVHWKRHVHRCSTTRSPPLNALTTRSYAPPKSESYFCRTLYIVFGIIRCYTKPQ